MTEFDIKRNLLITQLNNLDKGYIEEHSPFQVDDKFVYMQEKYVVLHVFIVRTKVDNKYVNKLNIRASKLKVGITSSTLRTFTEGDFKYMKKLQKS